MTKHKAKVYTLHLTEVVILVNGLMICSMGLVKKPGQINPTTKVIIMKEQNMEKAYIVTLTAASMMVNGLIIKSKE